MSCCFVTWQNNEPVPEPGKLCLLYRQFHILERQQKAVNKQALNFSCKKKPLIKKKYDEMHKTD